MPHEPIPFRTIVSAVLILLGILLALFYTTFQARYLITGPQIVLEEVPNTLQNEQKILLTGTAYNISHLWLNDRPIYTDASGHFKEALILENGYTTATLRAEDRYGRETTVAKQFVYAPKSFLP